MHKEEKKQGAFSEETPLDGSDNSGMTSESVFGVYATHEQATRMVRSLHDAGVPLRRIRIIGRGYHSEEQAIGFYTRMDRIRLWASAGLFWGGLWGLLFGTAFLGMPVLNVIGESWPVAHLLLSAIKGALLIGGLSALFAALFGLLTPNEKTIRYESDIKADHYQVIVRGNAGELDKESDLARELNAEHSISAV